MNALIRLLQCYFDKDLTKFQPNSTKWCPLKQRTLALATVIGHLNRWGTILGGSFLFVSHCVRLGAVFLFVSLCVSAKSHPFVEFGSETARPCTQTPFLPLPCQKPLRHLSRHWENLQSRIATDSQVISQLSYFNDSALFFFTTTHNRIRLGQKTLRFP